MFFLFFLAQMNNFVYFCRRNKNNLKVLALFISYYYMDERTIKIVNEARWTDGQIVRNRRELLTLDQVEIGKSYELVATTLSGLYRYRTNEIFYIVGHHHETPTVIIDK